jgi:hypothetical protein
MRTDRQRRLVSVEGDLDIFADMQANRPREPEGRGSCSRAGRGRRSRYADLHMSLPRVQAGFVHTWTYGGHGIGALANNLLNSDFW